MSVGGILGFECKRVRRCLSFFDLIILLGFWVFPGRGDRRWEALECVFLGFPASCCRKNSGVGRDKEGVFEVEVFR